MRVAEAPMLLSPTDGRRDSTTRGATAGRRARLLVHQPDLPAVLNAPGRGGADHWPAHRRQPAAHLAPPRPRAPHQLPARPVTCPLVWHRARLRADATRARPPRPRWAGRAG